MFHPISPIGAPNYVPLWNLWAPGYLQCVALQSDVTFMSRSVFPLNLRQCTMVHR